MPPLRARFALAILGLKVVTFCTSLCAQNAPLPEPTDPAAEIAAIEERLLAMAPTFAAVEKALSAEGITAFEDILFSGAHLLAPEQLPPPSSKQQFPHWAASRAVWEDLARPQQRQFLPDKTPPFNWLSPLLPEVGWAKLKTFDGELVPHGETFVFRTHHRLYLRPPEGEGQPPAEVTAELAFDWGFDGTRYRIVRLDLSKVTHLSTSHDQPLLGKEVLDQIIPSAPLLKHLRTNRHEDFLRAIYSNPHNLGAIDTPGFPLHHIEDLTYDSTEQHPALSVVDLNNDGWDDLYVMQRWGTNILLINQQDGTFEEETERYGLAIDGLCSCALFIDFDNDGDQDLFLGRTLEPSALYENDGQKFHKVSHRLEGRGWPLLVTSAAAADYDGDGLVDLYLSTYYGHTQSRGEGWQKKFLDTLDIEEHASRSADPDTDLFYNFVGPPNLLLKNLGGCRFQVARENATAGVWRSTFQATWSDWDTDGDPDLMITSDFAPDAMLENRRDPDGKRSFVDITEEQAPGVANNFFGMGASWGDYDLDGREDLYLSAMYSKAGTRITNRLSQFKPRARQSALGSMLLASRENNRWAVTSGSNKGQQNVHQVGWAWGGQFFDPNNDGLLDIYAPTGYFTPPPDYSSVTDF